MRYRVTHRSAAARPGLTQVLAPTQAIMSDTFGLKFTNIPVVNLRLDFVHTYRDALERVRRDSSRFKYLDCELSGHELDQSLSWSIRSSIINLECYVNYAVWYVLGCTENLTPEISQLLKNPYGHKKGICGSYYDTLPSLVDPTLSLRIYDNTLWQRTIALYREVRNPLFHGKDVSEISASAYFEIIEHIRLIYSWIDSWHKSDWGDLSCDHLVGAN